MKTSTPLQHRMKKLFKEGFLAMDIAQPLASFDDDKSVKEIVAILEKATASVLGMRHDGLVSGYMKLDPDQPAASQMMMLQFKPGQVLPQTAYLYEVIDVLEEHDFCFLSVLGNVSAVISRQDLQKPPVRMWLFGMITIIEMYMTNVLEKNYPNEEWQQDLSAGRLEKAKALQQERSRRGENTDLVDCLQLSDKSAILLKNDELVENAKIKSKRQAREMLKDIESLRNNLAHSQDFITYNWDAVVRLSDRLEITMSRV